VPASYTPSITNKEIAATPNYPDAGIEFKGYYKVKKADHYDIYPQEEYIYNFLFPLGGWAGGVIYSSSRSRSDKVFYVNKIIINYVQAAGYQELRIRDGTNQKTNIGLHPTTGESVYYEFSPKKFENTSIQVYIDTAIGATEFIYIKLIGWLEDKT